MMLAVPLLVRLALALRLPPVWVKVPVEVLVSRPLALKLPPFTFNALVLLAALVTVKEPAFWLMVPALSNW